MATLPALPTPPAQGGDWTAYDAALNAWRNSVDAYLRPLITGSGSSPAGPAASRTLSYDAIGARGLSDQNNPISWASTNGVKLIFGEVGVPASIDTNDTYDAKWDTVLLAWLIAARKASIPFQVWTSAEWNVGLRAYASANNTSGDLAKTTNVATDLEGYLAYSALNGVNLSGAEFGVGISGMSGSVPGTLGTDYYYPSNNDLTFLAGRGIKTIRLPFAWERAQLQVGAALDTTFVTNIKRLLDQAQSLGITLILDCHNYGRYTPSTGATPYLLGQTIPSTNGITSLSAGLVDLWQKIANQWGTHAGLNGYGIMNEPHDLTTSGDLGGSIWRSTSSDVGNALYAITKQAKNIFVAGFAYSTASDWANQNGQTPWLYTYPSGLNHALSVEPNVYFEAHMYFDNPNGGVYTNTYASNLSTAQAAGFTAGSITG